MSQDIVSDALNQMMNAVRAGERTLVLKRHSRLLLSILAIAKLRSYVKNYKVDGKKITVEINDISGCSAIKPRFLIPASDIDKYVSRYLPAKHIGIIIISTSQGLMTHHTAQEKNIGGSLIAYIY